MNRADHKNKAHFATHWPWAKLQPAREFSLTIAPGIVRRGEKDLACVDRRLAMLPTWRAGKERRSRGRAPRSGERPRNRTLPRRTTTDPRGRITAATARLSQRRADHALRQSL